MTVAGTEGDGAAASRQAVWAGWLTAGVAGLTPVLAYVGHLGFAPLVAIAGLLYLPFLVRDRAPLQGLAPLILLAIWALASMAWSLAGGRTLDLNQFVGVESLTGVKLLLELGLYAAFVAASLTLTPRGGSRAGLVLAIGLLALSALFIVEAVLKAPLYQVMRRAVGQATNPGWAMRDVASSSYVVVLLFWPAALRLAQARLVPAAIALAVVTAIGAYLLNADAPLAALLVSGAVFAAFRYLGRRALIAWVCALALYFAGAPIIIHALGPGALIKVAPDDIQLMSWEIRLDIWRFAAARILEHPFFGWGLDASRMFGASIPLHTHNGALQIWLELGAVGAALALVFWLWIAARIDEIEAYDRTLAAACAACASAYLTIGALSFGVWQEWWLALGALSVASCAALAAARRGLARPEPQGD